jgi:hypothetical protein
LMILARPGSAHHSHHHQPAPPRIGPRQSPCSGWVPSQRLRALAGPGGCRGPGCSVRQYVAWPRSAESGPQPCKGSAHDSGCRLARGLNVHPMLL